MICEKCKNEIPENIKFCGYCGHNHEDSVQEHETKTEDSKSSRKLKKQKKRTGIFMFILSFSLFMGIVGGMCGAYYVVKHGWEVVPFAERLTFIPFVKLKEEKMEIYTVPIDDLIEIVDDKESSLEN
ncbi:MAG: zinc ribbon domain-containing protein [Anaerolineaceae bacterium]|nr:MAG: zinc ribbon domain-containing protein [Anaerolineaceae bacterium]